MSRRDDEARQREELGGYTEAEFDREFVRSHRSDVASVAIRVVMLVIVYGLLARAIHRLDPPPWLLLLPFVVEFLLIFWTGWFLSAFVISCKAFAKSAGGIVRVAFASLLFGGAQFAAIVFNPGGVRPASVDAALREGWGWVVRTDLHWGLLAMAASLIVATTMEVARWQRERGVFVWAAVMNAGFRFAVALLLGFALVAIMVMFGEVLFTSGDSGAPVASSAAVWVLFGFVLVTEIVALALAVAMHRDASRKMASAAR